MSPMFIAGALLACAAVCFRMAWWLWTVSPAEIAEVERWQARRQKRKAILHALTEKNNAQ